MELTQNKTVSVVIPTYNEGEIIATVISRIFAVCPSCEVIVSDDASSDDTIEKALKAGAVVITHPYNMGNGAAVKSGFLASSGDWVVFLDGDGQHPPEEIPKLLKSLNKYDLVVGARTAASSTDKVRNLGNCLLNYVGYFVSGRKIPDLTSGFRAFRREAFAQVFHLLPTAYSYPSTSTLALMKLERLVYFEPIDGITRRTTGASNINIIKDFIKIVHIIFRVIFMFSPQRLTLPVSAVLMLVAVIFAVYQIMHSGGIMSSPIILSMLSLFFFLFWFTCRANINS